MLRIISKGGVAALILLGAAPLAAAPAKKANIKAAPTKAAKPPVYYDFKGARLGMTRAEWQALTPPVDPNSYVGSSEGPLKVFCTDTLGRDGKPVSGSGYLTDTEKSLGVVICRYGRLFTVGNYSSVSPATVKIGQFGSSDVDFKFLGGRLYEVSITGHKNLFGDVMDGLKAKFGEPDLDVNDTTQNKAGATFPHTVKTWINPVASITVETPFTKIDDLNVLYLDAGAAKRISDAEKALHPDAEKM